MNIYRLALGNVNIGGLTPGNVNVGGFSKGNVNIWLTMENSDIGGLILDFGVNRPVSDSRMSYEIHWQQPVPSLI